MIGVGTPLPASLGRAHALLNAVNEVGAAGADVGAEDIRAVTLVVHTNSQGL